MILQTGTKFDPIFQMFRKLFDPQGVALDEAKQDTARNPGQAAQLANATRRIQETFRDSLRQQQEFAQGATTNDEETFLEGPQGRGSEAAGESIFKDQARSLDEFAPTTELGAAQGRGGRETKSVQQQGFNPLAPLIASMGLDPNDPRSMEFLFANEAANPPSFEELVSTQRITEPGAVEEGTAALRAETRQRAEVARAGEVTARVTRIATEFFESMEGPEQEARTRLGKLTEEEAVSHMNALEAGFQTELNDESHRGYLAFLDTLPPADRNIAAAIIRNPNFFTRQLQLARMSLDERLARLRAATSKQESMVEIISNAVSLTEQRIGLAQQLSEAKAGKDNDLIKFIEDSLTGNSEMISAIGQEYPELDLFFPTPIYDSGQKPEDAVFFVQPRAGQSLIRGQGITATDPAQTREFAIESEQFNSMLKIYGEIASTQNMDIAVAAFNQDPGPFATQFRQKLRAFNNEGTFWNIIEKGSSDARTAERRRLVGAGSVGARSAKAGGTR